MTQTTLKEQLRDPLFRRWFATPPPLKRDTARTPPWYVYVQRTEGGPWARTEVADYVTGYRYIASHLKKFHDMALSHKRQQFRPPVVKQGKKRRYHYPPADTGHTWCPFCRRMTVFRYFAKHHSLPKWASNQERRCTICGARLEFILKYD